MIKQKEGYATDHYVEGDLIEKGELTTLPDGAKVINFKLRNLRQYVVRKKQSYPRKRYMTQQLTYYCTAWHDRAEDADIMFSDNDKIWVRGYFQWNDRYNIQELVVDECGRWTKPKEHTIPGETERSL